MDKNALKKYAVWARRELISRVSQKALQYGISDKDCGEANVDSVNGKVLTPNEKSQRNSLIEKIKSLGYQEAMEEAAYTWFNRFTALRYMEVNGYLPSHVRVFTDEANNFKPQIIDEAIHLDIEGLDMDKVYAYKEANDTEELYKYLLITQCNAFGEIFPGMFSEITDFTILLFPDNVLREGSVLEQMISIIPEDDWKDQIQIIGWLYQYYISEKHDSVIDSLHKKAISKENIPAATQLFTTDWVVRYIVDNTLGKYWIERNNNSALKNELQFLITCKTGTVEKDLEYVSPENITVFDPCIGSGHFVAYAFDVLIKIYQECGYSERDAASLIVKNNIFGADIDVRAVQLASFTVMMKARQYDRRFFSKKITPHIHVISESNHVNSEFLELFCDNNPSIINDMNCIVKHMNNAKEYGSIISIDPDINWELLFKRFEELENDIHIFKDATINELLPLVQAAYLLSRKYSIVVTNPPYFNKYSDNFRKFLNIDYKDYSGDLFSVFMIRNLEYCNEDGYTGFMTPNVWMFLVLYGKLRDRIISNHQISSFLHIAKGSFFKEATVDVCAFIIKKKLDQNQRFSSFIDLSKYKNTMEFQEIGLLDVLNKHREFQYDVDQSMFKSFPDTSLAYWASERIQKIYTNSNLYERTISDGQNITGNNERFLRFTWEPDRCNVGENRKWNLCAKGGQYRKWYGNIIDLIDWSDEARLHYRKDKIARIVPDYLWYKPCITWSNITSYKPSFRIVKEGWLFEKKGASIFIKDEKEYYSILALLNTKVSEYLISTLTQALSFQVRDIRSIPFIAPPQSAVAIIDTLSKECVSISESDWNLSEISWDFKKHPFIRPVATIKEAYELWVQECSDRRTKLKDNEEELNRIFIDIYGLQDELTPEIEGKDITVSEANLQKDIKSFISYAVGCMFGRYSLDSEGLAYAGGEWDNSKYMSFSADKDNIIPICDNEYFDDDLTGLFVRFVKTVFGEDTLEENLKFIADALGGKGNPRTVIRNYFLNGFFADHCKTYQKRPIYWLFDSGKKNGFKALIYMHRYQPDTIARLRTDYVHEQQSRYRTAIADIEKRISGASGSEAVKLNKELEKLTSQADELITYEEKIHHLADQMIKIDLDDGVKHNYEIFKDVLAKIK